jgi:hypothetical protein
MVFQKKMCASVTLNFFTCRKGSFSCLLFFKIYLWSLVKSKNNVQIVLDITIVPLIIFRLYHGMKEICVQ